MKVCTDSCLFGAWIPAQNGGHVLDIGTGTGLLTLMLAQRSTKHTQFTAIDIDHLALQDAATNFTNAPWHSQIMCIQADITLWAGTVNHKFDVIVCNPPFFNSHLKGTDAQKNAALHAEQLQPATLAAIIRQLLFNHGKAYVLYPPFEANKFIEHAQQQGLFLHKSTTVFNKTGGKPFRQMLALGFDSKPAVFDSINIRDADSYSNEFTALLKPYYLAL
jgi:tRNA1Val (adenine37-N6)-methyltransferase